MSIIIYTDGSCLDKRGGFGIVVIKGEDKIGIKGKVPVYPCTNNIAELYAIYQALNHIDENAILFTDSKYCIGCITEWCRNWVKNGWKNSKKKPVENKEIIQTILKTIGDRNLKIDFRHVKAHNGDKYNEIADNLANEGRML